MITKTIDSTIERRLLLTYRIDPDRVAAQLPAPFRPQLVGGWAVGGICLIRLAGIRIPGAPKALGITTENAAHRFAVEWDDDERTTVGAYIPRRETSSRLAAMSGGRAFSGEYRKARFSVRENGSEVSIDVVSRDGAADLSLEARDTTRLDSSLFADTDTAVRFFRAGAHGYSPASTADRVDAVRLESPPWDARPVEIQRLESSFFADEDRFPCGSQTFDSALVMRDLPARWVSDGVIESRSMVQASAPAGG